MRLGLLGGTFDPIHVGHVKVARAAAARGLDRVLFVPVRQPPHKSRADIAGAFHRFGMAVLATVGEPILAVSPYEVAREGPSYTIDTVRHFRAAGHDVTLIMGTDSLVELETWRECRALLELAGVIAYPRRPAVDARLAELLPDWIGERLRQERPPGTAGAIVCLDQPPDDTSSTAIRNLLRSGRSVSGLLAPATEEYILKHHLYVDGLEGSTD